MDRMDGRERERGGFESLADVLDMLPCAFLQVVLAGGRIPLLMLHSPLHDVLEEPLLEAMPLATEAAERVDPVDIVHKDVHGFCHAGSGASGRHGMFQFHALRQLSTSFGIQLEDHLLEEAVQHGLRVFGARGCRHVC